MNDLWKHKKVLEDFCRILYNGNMPFFTSAHNEVHTFGDADILDVASMVVPQDPVLLGMLKPKRCSYCRNEWHPDSRGGCSSCGGPDGNKS